MQQWGAKVDDAILDDLFPAGGDLGVSPAGQEDNLKATALALGIVERHLTRLSHRQLAALAFLRMEGGQLAELADWYLQTVNMTGPVDPLLTALERASLIRSFRGVRGSLVGGKLPGPAGGGGR